MKKLSQVLLADTISRLRKEQSMTQQELAEKTGINRSLISRIEKKDFMPSIPQLEALGEALGFEPYDMFTESRQAQQPFPPYRRFALLSPVPATWDFQLRHF